MTTIRELITKWGFKVDHEPLEKIEKKLDGIQERLEFLATLEVVKGIFELTEKFAHFAEELHAAAVSAGETVESFQKLTYAGNQAAVSSEEMGGALAKLARNLYNARQGSEQAQKAFSDVGITPDQVKGVHKASDAMLLLADRFKNINDPIEKSALAMQLMGRGSVNMVAFLSQGSGAIKKTADEAEHLGAVLSEHQVHALQKVENSMNTLFAIMKTFAATIASYFAPSIETAIADFLKFYEVNRKLIDLNVRAWVWDITYALGFVWEAVKTATQAFFDFAKSHQTLTRRAIEFIVALTTLAGVIWTLQKALSVVSKVLELIGVALSPLKLLWNYAFMPAVTLIGGILQSSLTWILLRLALLTETVLPALSGAFLALGAAIEATPVGWLLTAIAALVVVLHDAWTLLTGGNWEDTWLAKAFNAVKGWGSKALSFFGLNGNDEAATTGAANSLNAANNLSSVPNFFGPPAPNASQAGSANSFQIDAPVTINVPAATDPKHVGDKVKEGIAEHMDRVYRRAQQSLAPAQSY